MKIYKCYVCENEFETKFKPSNIERPYCSRSCSATYNNRLYPKRGEGGIKRCINCRLALVATQKKYCSSDCQTSHKRKAKINEWKINGELGHSVPNFIRIYLLEKQADTCSICATPQIWNNKSLIFIADHIDGNSKNNNEENLRMICPNCDSQLPTFKGRNRGNGRFIRRQRYLEEKSY